MCKTKTYSTVSGATARLAYIMDEGFEPSPCVAVIDAFGEGTPIHFYEALPNAWYVSDTPLSEDDLIHLRNGERAGGRRL